MLYYSQNNQRLLNLFVFFCVYCCIYVSHYDTLESYQQERMILMDVTPGEQIKELRVLEGMSQEELGRRVGVQRAAINKYEKGTVTNIPIQTIEKIAYVFNVSPNYIVGWLDDNRNPLSVEVKTLKGVKKFYGVDAVDLLESYSMLSKDGKKRVSQYAAEMTKIYKNE